MPKHIDKSECLSCGLCENTCLVGCIYSIDNGIRIVDTSACVDCSACTLVCPTNCITDL